METRLTYSQQLNDIYEQVYVHAVSKNWRMPKRWPAGDPSSHAPFRKLCRSDSVSASR
jgi:hypothetical protein